MGELSLRESREVSAGEGRAISMEDDPHLVRVLYAGAKEGLYNELQKKLGLGGYRFERWYDDWQMHSIWTAAVILDARLTTPEEIDLLRKNRPELVSIVIGDGEGSLEENKRYRSNGASFYMGESEGSKELAGIIRELTRGRRRIGVKHREPLVALVVDDSEDYRGYLNSEGFRELARGIMPEGYVLKTAANRSEAIQQAITNKFGAVILDQVFPEDSGIKIGEDLSDLWPLTPIIVNTGHGSSADLNKASRKIKVFKYVEKSEPVELARAIAAAYAYRINSIDVTLRKGKALVYCLSGVKHSGKSELAILLTDISPWAKLERRLSTREPRRGEFREFAKDVIEKEFITEEEMDRLQKTGEAIVYQRSGDDYRAGFRTRRMWNLLDQGYDVVLVVADPSAYNGLEEEFGDALRKIRVDLPFDTLEKRLTEGEVLRNNNGVVTIKMLERLRTQQIELSSPRYSFHHRVNNFTLKGDVYAEADSFRNPAENLLNYMIKERFGGTWESLLDGLSMRFNKGLPPN